MRTYPLSTPPVKWGTNTPSATTMLCLSIKQPWSFLIVNGKKDFENRTWKPIRPIVGLCLVHASRMPDRAWREIIAYLAKEKGIVVPENAACGAIVGVMYITGVVSVTDKGVDRDHPDYFWFQGPHAFKLDRTKAKAFEKVIPYNGRLGFYQVPMIPQIKEQL